LRADSVLADAEHRERTAIDAQPCSVDERGQVVATDLGVPP
jgi:hypothetical protein